MWFSRSPSIHHHHLVCLTSIPNSNSCGPQPRLPWVSEWRCECTLSPQQPPSINHTTQWSQNLVLLFMDLSDWSTQQLLERVTQRIFLLFREDIQGCSRNLWMLALSLKTPLCSYVHTNTSQRLKPILLSFYLKSSLQQRGLLSFS